MTPSFTVITTSHFERELRKLGKRHADLVAHYARVVETLEHDPYNRSRAHPIKKLENVAVGGGQYRIRLGRFRFRYDIEEKTVYLKLCSLRREDTYR